ncbi:hypothetical protein PPERSA_05366 [Pseudocohnilembus persalinus]|uniref:Transmembrane protein n=1 Tax=Pseudocohnilembus persalinus TaxID=266149 RepID=A0A0V0R7U0_PSEPJ|nr:hypothetical protein PPERSA_05366 [Pseudocohnilembus persalinus]|eukprot:KRX10546.1 hypothetical protein PPERSA_05366 [Pseudocohnilembus persalinus]
MGINWSIQTSLLCITCPIILVVFMFYLAIYKSTFREIYAEVDKIYKPIPEIEDQREQQKFQEENFQYENKEFSENNQQLQQQLYIDPIQNELHKNFLDNGYEIGQKVDVA